MKKNIVNFWMVTSLSSAALMSDGTLPVFAQSDSKEDTSASHKDPVFQVAAHLHERDKASLRKIVQVLDATEAHDVMVILGHVDTKFRAKTSIPCTGGCSGGGCDMCASVAMPGRDALEVIEIHLEANGQEEKQRFIDACDAAGFAGGIVWVGKTAKVGSGLSPQILEKVYRQLPSGTGLYIDEWRMLDSTMSYEAKDAFQRARIDMQKALNDPDRRAILRRALSKD